jgi:phosphopantothenate synthetase
MDAFWSRSPFRSRVDIAIPDLTQTIRVSEVTQLCVEVNLICLRTRFRQNRFEFVLEEQNQNKLGSTETELETGPRSQPNKKVGSNAVQFVEIAQGISGQHGFQI